MRRPMHLMIVITLLLAFAMPMYAQDDIPSEQPVAALLEVTFAGVEIRRVETDTWIELPPGAVTPFGAGDSVRTNETGRALISTASFPQHEILVLPNTEFLIDEQIQVPFVGGNFLGTLVRGRTIHFVDLAQYTDYRVNTDAFTMIFLCPDCENSMPDVFRNVTLVSSDDGKISVIPNGTEIAISSDDPDVRFGGNVPLYFNGTVNRLTDEVQNPAMAEGLVDGCPGVVTTESGRDLNSRAGPSTFDVVYGIFPNGADVRVMGVVESGGWYRVQYRSGFGWVQRLAVNLTDADCTFPTLPDDSFDVPNRVINPTERELELLAPFYGAPADDPIFYRFE